MPGMLHTASLLNLKRIPVVSATFLFSRLSRYPFARNLTFSLIDCALSYQLRYLALHYVCIMPDIRCLPAESLLCLGQTGTKLQQLYPPQSAELQPRERQTELTMSHRHRK